jgi:hypothetical protein
MTRHLFAVVKNPAYGDRAPEQLTPSCHDGSAPLTIQCSCDAQMHLHESQLAAVPEHAIIRSRCSGCGDALELDVDELKKAYQLMRDLGWHT